ncbi:uncharacterized protein METZ01_LOCUS155302, partial [marine metagenome]
GTCIWMSWPLRHCSLWPIPGTWVLISRASRDNCCITRVLSPISDSAQSAGRITISVLISPS